MHVAALSVTVVALSFEKSEHSRSECYLALAQHRRNHGLVKLSDLRVNEVRRAVHPILSPVASGYPRERCVMCMITEGHVARLEVDYNSASSPRQFGLSSPRVCVEIPAVEV